MALSPRHSVRIRAPIVGRGLRSLLDKESLIYPPSPSGRGVGVREPARLLAPPPLTLTIPAGAHKKSCVPARWRECTLSTLANSPSRLAEGEGINQRFVHYQLPKRATTPRHNASRSRPISGSDGFFATAVG